MRLEDVASGGSGHVDVGGAEKIREPSAAGGQSRMSREGGGRDEAVVIELQEFEGVRIRRSEPTAPYTSIKVGGPADYLIDARNQIALARLLALLAEQGLPVWLLGNGSNVVISDLGVRGAVIRLVGEFNETAWREEGGVARVRVGAGCLITRLVREAVRRGYAGLEFAEGIPGTVGGALAMNAGAYGSEFEKIVEEVEGLTREGKPIRLQRSQMKFAYRDSNLPPGTVVTFVLMRLRPETPAAVGARVRELALRRKRSQPSGRPNSGSMFRNPPGDYAGRLIEAAGLKGRRVGQTQISEKHGNFIVNLGGGKAVEVRQLMDLARAEVRARFGVELQPEVKFLGEWPEQNETGKG